MRLFSMAKARFVNQTPLPVYNILLMLDAHLRVGIC